MKKLLTIVMSIFLLVGACFSLTACGKDTESAIEDGKLTIGYTIYAPMNYFEDSTFVGFDTELAKAFCEEIGVEADFVEINWDNKFTDLESKAIDCIWNGMTITDEVKEKTAVSAPYLENKQVVICKTENVSKFTNIESILQATSVAFESGSAGESVATTAGVEESKVVKLNAQKDCILEVSSQASEIAIIDLTMAKVLVGEGSPNPGLTYVDVGFELEQFGVAFRKSDAGLAKAFDLFIKLCKSNDIFNNLSSKYFG